MFLNWMRRNNFATYLIISHVFYINFSLILLLVNECVGLHLRAAILAHVYPKNCDWSSQYRQNCIPPYLCKNVWCSTYRCLAWYSVFAAIYCCRGKLHPSGTILCYHREQYFFEGFSSRKCKMFLRNFIL